MPLKTTNATSRRVPSPFWKPRSSTSMWPRLLQMLDLTSLTTVWGEATCLESSFPKLKKTPVFVFLWTWGVLSVSMLVFFSPKKLLFLFSSLRNLTRLLYPADEEDKIKEADETNKDDVEVELKNQFDVLYIINEAMMMVLALVMMMMMATAMVVMVTWRWSLRSSWTSCTSSLVFDVSPFSVISPTTLGFSVLGFLQGDPIICTILYKLFFFLSLGVLARSFSKFAQSFPLLSDMFKKI